MTIPNDADERLLTTAAGLKYWPAARRAAWLGLMETHRRVVRALERDLEGAGGRGYKAYELLAGLAHSRDGRMRISEIADHTLLSQSRVSRMVDDLERDGLVARGPCDDDSRVVFVSITEDGLEALHEVQDAFFASVEEQLFGRLSEREVEELARILGGALSDGSVDDSLSADPARGGSATSRPGGGRS
jgi:DNA-binding MarR family transcriptional regulator